MIPYLKPPNVWPIRRCFMEFYNSETEAATEFYKGHRRFRFNKWQPMVKNVPTPTQFGLDFNFSDHNPLDGLMSSFTVPSKEKCSVKFTFSNISYYMDPPEPLHTWMPPPFTPLPAEPAIVEFGIGIQRYTAGYWWPIDGMELAIRRGNNYVEATGLRSQSFTKWSSTAGLNIATMTFEAKVDNGNLYVAIAEYNSDGTVVGSYSWTVPSAPPDHIDWNRDGVPDDVEYRFTLFGRVKYGVIKATLTRTDISDYTKPYWGTREYVQFIENPETFEIMDAEPRHPDTHIYPQPHIAYVEDGDIQCSSAWCDEQWFNIMKLLIDSTVEPFYFYDIEGRQWLCCFADFSGTGRRGFFGRQQQGYSLTMPILVVH